jgi:hypothetical protein
MGETITAQREQFLIRRREEVGGSFVAKHLPRDLPGSVRKIGTSAESILYRIAERRLVYLRIREASVNRDFPVRFPALTNFPANRNFPLALRTQTVYPVSVE